VASSSVTDFEAFEAVDSAAIIDIVVGCTVVVVVLADVVAVVVAVVSVVVKLLVIGPNCSLNNRYWHSFFTHSSYIHVHYVRLQVPITGRHFKK